MKKNNSNTLRILLVACLLSVSACNNSGSGTTSTTDSTSTVKAKIDTAVQDVKQGAQNMANDVKNAVAGNTDSNFVVKATLANMEELKILQAGWDNGTSKELKAHAKMMIADHKKLGAKVKEYATKKGYILPDNDNGKGDDAVASLNKNSKGNDWDKAWADKMVDGHKDAIDLFENNQNSVKDADLKALITDALPTLHSHLDMMKQLQDKLGK